MPNVQPHSWVDRGGAYWIIAGMCVLSAALYFWWALRIGARHESEGEGCLLALMNPLFALAGGGAGFFLAGGQYPLLLYTASLGAFALPGVATWIFARRLRPHG